MVDGTGGEPRELHLLYPHRLTAIPDPVNFLSAYRYQGLNGFQQDFPAFETRPNNRGIGGYQVPPRKRTVCVNRAGTVTVTLPSTPYAGQTVTIKDISGAGATNPITITPSSGTGLIDGAANIVINTNYGKATLTYTGSDWAVV